MAMAMAMAMGAASKTTMAVTMSMPSRTRTTARRTTSGTREVRARASTTTTTRDVEARLGASRLGSTIDSGTPRRGRGGWRRATTTTTTRARRMGDDEETRAHRSRPLSSSSSRAHSVRVVSNRARDVHDEGRGRLEREGFFSAREGVIQRGSGGEGGERKRVETREARRGRRPTNGRGDERAMMPVTREANDDARTDQRILSTRVGETRRRDAGRYG